MNIIIVLHREFAIFTYFKSTCVGFVEGSRIVGTDAENSRAKNYKNTLVNFLPLVGKLANDRSCVKALDNIFQTTATNEDGRILLQV